MQSEFEWRGLVNQVSYGVDLMEHVDDAHVTRVADSIVHQRTFGMPPEKYYDAITAAVSSGASVSDDPAAEETVHNFLSRLISALDGLRPWPVLPYTKIYPTDWPALQQASKIGRVDLSQIDIEDRLHRSFDLIAGRGGEVLVLRLRTGETIALDAPASRAQVGIDLLATTDDPSETRRITREVTGLNIEETT